MIRKCAEVDRKTLLEYLYRDSCLNLFFIGDIHNFGFESDFQHVFMEEENGEIISVYLVYRDNMCLQSYNGRLDRLFAEKLLRIYPVKRHCWRNMISAVSAAVPTVILPASVIRARYLMTVL